MERTTKVCPKCGIEKSLFEFCQRSLPRKGPRSYCKQCERDLQFLRFRPKCSCVLIASKFCSTCKIDKPSVQFSRSTSSKDGLFYECKQCNSIRGRKRSLRRHWLKKTYGISQEEYLQLLEKQNHQCAICKVPQSEELKTFHLDHCHKTKKVRGILCHKCNVGLGHMRDDPQILQAALDYLAQYGSMEVHTDG